MKKNIFDKLLALFLIILFSPLYLIVSLLIFFKMGNPIFFRQKRPGYKEKIFGIYKFRTMTNEKDKLIMSNNFSSPSVSKKFNSKND